MLSDDQILIPDWPAELQQVDVARLGFSLRFDRSCRLQPTDFLELGRSLRLAGRQSFAEAGPEEYRQWQALFQANPSDDPVARRKYQKPSPPFVIHVPIMQPTGFAAEDELILEVLFLGIGIPLIHGFLRSLIHLGCLGLASGSARYQVQEVCVIDREDRGERIWRKDEPPESLACHAWPVTWLLQDLPVGDRAVVRFQTPTRLLADGKPLRKPDFMQVFPFMLRRVSSMLYAHGGVEVLDDHAATLESARLLLQTEQRLRWHDWHVLKKRHGVTLGGFMGELVVSGAALQEVFWVVAVASLLGIGKGAAYGAGRFSIGC